MIILLKQLLSLTIRRPVDVQVCN